MFEFESNGGYHDGWAIPVPQISQGDIISKGVALRNKRECADFVAWIQPTQETLLLIKSGNNNNTFAAIECGLGENRFTMNRGPISISGNTPDDIGTPVPVVGIALDGFGSSIDVIFKRFPDFALELEDFKYKVAIRVGSLKRRKVNRGYFHNAPATTNIAIPNFAIGVRFLDEAVSGVPYSQYSYLNLNLVRIFPISAVGQLGVDIVQYPEGEFMPLHPDAAFVSVGTTVAKRGVVQFLLQQ